VAPLLETPRFLGVLSKERAARIMEQLEEEGVSRGEGEE